MSNSTLELLLSRRSVKLLDAPGPSAGELEQILTAAARVPDHKALTPWRFIVFEGDARAAFGEVLANALIAEEKEPPSPVRLDTERQRLSAFPLTIAVVSRAHDTPGAPEWEQVLSSGAACQNIVIAANALGYGSNWVTRWFAYSPTVRAHLGLASGERIAGFIHIGTPRERQPDRKRPALGDVVTRYGE
jgi:nitroreductase